VKPSVIVTVILVVAGCSVDGRGLALPGVGGQPRRGSGVVPDAAFEVQVADSGAPDLEVAVPDVRSAAVLDALVADVAAVEAHSPGPEVSVPDVSPVVVADALADARGAGLYDVLPGFSSAGVFVNLGVNPCASGGWDSATGKCYPPAVPQAKRGVCGPAPSCGTHEPGTVLLWDAEVNRYRYLEDPSGGLVCLPNDAPYVVSC